MKLKNFLILLVGFIMVFSLFVSVNPYPAIQPSSNQISKIQQNSCPILVKSGETIVPIDLVNITGVWKYQDYNFASNWDQQTAQNYFTGYYDNSKGLIYNLTLVDNTQVVVAGFNSKNNSYQVLSDFCFNPNPCGGFIAVFNQQINGSFPFTSIIGVYVQNNFNYNASPITNQGSKNYFTTSSTYSNGQIFGINLPDGTAVVVVGKDNQGNIFFMDSFCPSPNYGVKEGDTFTYNFKTDATGTIPLFDLNNGTPIIANGDSFQVGISKITPDNITLKFTIANTNPFETNNTMFFIVPLDFINSLISGTFAPNQNNAGPIPTFLGSTSNTIKLGIYDSHGNMTVVLDRIHGNLVSLDGVFLDPQNNIIKMNIKLIYSPYGIPNANTSFNKYHKFGVNKGDSFIYNFTTNAPNKIPFFGLNGDNPIIQNGDAIKVNVVDMFNSLDQPPLLLQYSIGSNAPFQSNNSIFFIVPIDMLNAVFNGTYTPDSNSNDPAIQLISDNNSVIVVRANSSDFLATLQFDKQHGNLISLTGKITDPQNNTFNISLTLSTTNITNQSSSGKESNILTTAPGFELVAFLPLVPILVAMKKKKHT